MLCYCVSSKRWAYALQYFWIFFKKNSIWCDTVCYYISVFILLFSWFGFNMFCSNCLKIVPKLIFMMFLPHIGAEVAVLCITKSGEVINYQAFTNSKGMYTVAETMPESDRWDSCLARPISSFHLHCTRRGDAHSGVKFTYNKPSGNSHTVKTFLYKPVTAPLYCS
jgi:hypothetical protein